MRKFPTLLLGLILGLLLFNSPLWAESPPESKPIDWKFWFPMIISLVGVLGAVVNFCYTRCRDRGARKLSAQANEIAKQALEEAKKARNQNIMPFRESIMGTLRSLLKKAEKSHVSVYDQDNVRKFSDLIEDGSIQRYFNQPIQDECVTILSKIRRYQSGRREFIKHDRNFNSKPTPWGEKAIGCCTEKIIPMLKECLEEMNKITTVG